MTKKIIALLTVLLFIAGTTVLYGSHEERFERGKASYKKKKYQSAYIDFKAAVSERPDIAKYQYNLGLAARKLNYYREALDAFQEARHLDPSMNFTKKKQDFLDKIKEMQSKAGVGTTTTRSQTTKTDKPYQQPDSGKKGKKKGGLPTWFIILCGVVGLGVLIRVLGRKKRRIQDVEDIDTTGTGTRYRTYRDDDYHDRDRYDDYDVRRYERDSRHDRVSRYDES
jgi:tetratricopeptide (TPR) repeat protein